MINAFEGEAIEDDVPRRLRTRRAACTDTAHTGRLRRMNERRAGLRGLLKGQICDAQIGKA